MDNFKEKLIAEAKNYNLNINEEQAEKFQMYKDLLLEWNKVMNLTAIVDEDDIILKHFIDSLICTRYISEENSIIDIGTGAGFPGIPLAIYYPNKNIILLDSLNKRINFLNEVKDKLNLKNINCIHARAEELAHDKEFREKYDIAVSRAVAAMNILIEINSAYVKKDGKIIFMKGSNYKEEIEKSKNAMNLLNMKLIAEDEYLLSDDITHSIIVTKKEKNTAEKYPRIFGKIKKQPL